MYLGRYLITTQRNQSLWETLLYGVKVGPLQTPHIEALMFVLLVRGRSGNPLQMNAWLSSYVERSNARQTVISEWWTNKHPGNTRFRSWPHPSIRLHNSFGKPSQFSRRNESLDNGSIFRWFNWWWGHLTQTGFLAPTPSKSSLGRLVYPFPEFTP